MSAFAAPPQRALRTDFNVEPVGFLSRMKEKAQKKLGELKEFGGQVVDAAKAAKKAAEEALKNKQSSK